MGTSVAHAESRRELMVLLLIAGVAAFVVFLYEDTFSSMAAIWKYSDYRYGFIVPPICAYLLWRVRAPIAAAELRPCVWSIGPLLGIVALWLVARAVGVQVVEQFAAVLLIPATVVAFLGWEVARRAMFPLLFLVAAVPVGDGVVPQLMQITADISTVLLRAVGVPVFREGQFLDLPGGNFEVAHVCSGLGFATAGTLIALLFSYLTYRSVLKRVVFVTITAVVMVLTNGVRAFIVMYVASGTQMRYLAGRDHVFFGWVLFALVVVGLMHVGGRFADASVEGQERLAEAASPERNRLFPVVLVFGLVMLAATAQPLHVVLGDSSLWLWPAAGLLLWTIYRTVDSSPLVGASLAAVGGVRYRSARSVLVLCLVPLILAAGPHLFAKPPPAGEAASLPVELASIGGCRRAGAWSESWLPQFHLPDTVMSGSYSCSGHRVNVFVATYAGNTQGRELVTHVNRAVPEAVQQRAAVRSRAFSGKDGQTIRVNELQVDASGSSSLVWYWYRAGKTAAASPAFLKVEQVLGLLLGRRVDNSVYVLDTPLDESADSSRERLAAMARGLSANEVDEQSVVSAARAPR